MLPMAFQAELIHLFCAHAPAALSDVRVVADGATDLESRRMDVFLPLPGDGLPSVAGQAEFDRASPRLVNVCRSMRRVAGNAAGVFLQGCMDELGRCKTFLDLRVTRKAEVAARALVENHLAVFGL